MTRQKLLLMEDDALVARTMALLVEDGWDTTVASTMAEARVAIRDIAFDAWIVEDSLGSEFGPAIIPWADATFGCPNPIPVAVWSTMNTAALRAHVGRDVALFDKTDLFGLLRWLDADAPRRRCSLVGSG